VNRTRVRVDAEVHALPFGLLPGYRAVQLARDDDNVIQHFWIDSYQELWHKHMRYLRYEGRAHYVRGDRFSAKDLLKHSAKAFLMSLFRYDGWRHGFRGVFLSAFYALYTAAAWMALWRYQSRGAGDHSSVTSESRS
jgi:hypothetical protein